MTITEQQLPTPTSRAAGPGGPVAPGGPMGPGAPFGPLPPELRAGMPPSIQTEGGAALISWLREKQRTAPVWRDAIGCLHNFTHREVTRVMSDYQTFSSDITRLQPGSSYQGGGSLMLTDPPQHRVLRGLVIQAFTRRMSASMLPRIADCSAEILAEIDADGLDSFDLVERFAHPLPVTIIGELLGVPVTDRALFRTWADRLVSLHVSDPSTTDIPKMVGSAMAEMGGYLAEHVRDRRQHPRDDLLTKLVQAEVDGVRLTDQEVVNSSCLVLLAGQITSTMALGSSVLLLHRHPDALAEVRADPGLIPAAFEEVLRCMPPLTQAARIATQDTTVGGEAVSANGLVINWLLGANHDEQQFPDPERFDLHRPNAKQYAFGHGIHFCLGAPLARAEAEVGLRLLLERFRSVEIDLSALAYYEDPMFGVKSLPVIVERA